MLESTILESKKYKQNSQFIDKVIFLAWSDKISFENIFFKTGLKEDAVIKILRKELKPKSFKNWRKRVNGRKSKHRKINELKK
tara:strand:- start:120 stop:368 length:249 start_codon:yes stop_codon:yes gene_type:complete